MRGFSGDERGSEVVSTVLVQGLVVLVILLLIQLAFASHVRTMSVSAASEGARRGGLLGGDEQEAVARTSELLDSLVGASRDREISVTRESDAGTDILVVTVRTRLPLVGAMAADAGAREAARILAEDVERQGDAEHAVSLIVEDFGVETQPVVSSSCQACDSAEAMIEVRVSVRVPLPFLPAWLGPVGMDVSSSANAPLREVVAGG